MKSFNNKREIFICGRVLPEDLLQNWQNCPRQRERERERERGEVEEKGKRTVEEHQNPRVSNVAISK
jgi:hypothetical protein